MVANDHDNLFVAAEAVHALGISVLIYKLVKEKTCSGLSLKPQELTALFLAVRLYCSFVMEYDILTLLDSATLIRTLWVIYMIRFKLTSSYMDDRDNFAIYYVLRVMQNTKIVEPFTVHYVLAMGIARFLSCAHWVLQVLDARGRLLTALGYGLWPSIVHGLALLDRPDFHPCRFLLLLCDECHWPAARATPSFRSRMIQYVLKYLTGLRIGPLWLARVGFHLLQRQFGFSFSVLAAAECSCL